MNRRQFLERSWLGSLTVASGCSLLPSGGRGPERLFFTASGKTCVIDSRGHNFGELDVSAAGQVTWQPAGFLEDGRVLLLSMEARRDGPGRPFDEYYHQTPTHVWAYDLHRKSLEELTTRERLAPFYAPQLVLQGGRILMQVIRTRPGQTFNMRLDGSEAREFTGPDEGLPYGYSLSPDGQRVAFHLASREGYQIWTCDTHGGNRVKVAAQPGHLYFGPSWSPDGQWLAFQDCHAPVDPGHDWSDVCVCRPDGTGFRILTEGPCGSEPPTARQAIAAAVPMFLLGRTMATSSPPCASRARECRGNIKRSGPTPIISTASSNPTRPAAAPPSLGSIRRPGPSAGSLHARTAYGISELRSFPGAARSPSAAPKRAERPTFG